MTIVSGSAECNRRDIVVMVLFLYDPVFVNVSKREWTTCLLHDHLFNMLNVKKVKHRMWPVCLDVFNVSEQILTDKVWTLSDCEEDNEDSNEGDDDPSDPTETQNLHRETQI